MDTKEIAIGANKNECRSDTYRTATPEPELGVVGDGVGNPLAENGLAYVFRVTFVRKFR